MKLYTEEQVIEMLNRARLQKQDDTYMFTNDYLLSQETPIELPSDEEIEEASNNTFSDFFYHGAKWMKEQILGKEDKTFKQKSKLVKYYKQDGTEYYFSKEKIESRIKEIEDEIKRKEDKLAETIMDGIFKKLTNDTRANDTRGND